MIRMRYIAVIGVCTLLLGMLVGCDLVENSQPTSARARVTSADGRSITLVVSKVFLAQYRQTATGTERIVSIIDADTTSATSLLDQSYDIEREQRFLVQVPVPDSLRNDVRLEAWIDGERQYNRLASEEDSLLQFVYVYQGSNTPSDDDRL